MVICGVMQPTVQNTACIGSHLALYILVFRGPTNLIEVWKKKNIDTREYEGP